VAVGAYVVRRGRRGSRYGAGRNRLLRAGGLEKGRRPADLARKTLPSIVQEMLPSESSGLEVPRRHLRRSACGRGCIVHELPGHLLDRRKVAEYGARFSWDAATSQFVNALRTIDRAN
jgi:hypothetical protein